MKKGNCERRTEGGLNGEEGAGELKRRERENGRRMRTIGRETLKKKDQALSWDCWQFFKRIQTGSVTAAQQDVEMADSALRLNLC